MRVIAIDWSGDLSAARQRISLAEVVGRRLVRLEEGRDREAVAGHLLDESRRTPAMVVGLDFAFSLPAWFLRERGLPNVRALWALTASEGESWLARCEPPFWGRPGRPRPPDLLDEERAFRLTERAVPAVGGIRPKSVFQIGGAGAVGTGSLRGMKLLHRLAAAGFSIWPFDPPGLPRVVEIYPRVLTGPVNKSSPPERLRRLLTYIETTRVEVEPSLLDPAAATVDAFDAALSAFEMARHADEIASLPPAADPRVLLEGAIWVPRPGRVWDPAQPAPARAAARPARAPTAPATAHSALAPSPEARGRRATPSAEAAARQAKPSPEATVRAFVGRINANDAAGLADLMAESHVFVDALGRKFTGREAMRREWESFFEEFPGYRIEVSDVLSNRGGVGLFGFASGECRAEGRGVGARRWRVPAAWRAIVAAGQVVEWQVYCDTGWARPPGGEDRSGT